MSFKRFTYSSIRGILIIVRSKNKSMTIKTPHTQYFLDRLRSTPILVISSIMVICAAFIITPHLVRADSYQAQINALNQQNAATQGSINSLEGIASNYQQEINDLQSQIYGIQSAIWANQAKQASLNTQIANNQAELVQQKAILADDIKTMYVSGQLTPVEMLATSDNLSDFIDQQVAYNAIQQKIQSTVDQINALQQSLKDQQTQVAALLQTEQTQNQTLLSDQNQENSLLSYNQQQQDSYNQQIKSNNSEIATLEAEQAAANASIAKSVHVTSAEPSGGSGGLCDIGYGNGGYPMPWCNNYQDAVTDSYDFPNRECTSFANWYFINEEGQRGFSVSGNAGWWYLTSNYPANTWSGGVQPGALGVEPSSSLNAPVPSLHGGYYGHVMIVLALPDTTYNGSFPMTSNVAGTQVPDGYVLVMSMNEDEEGHFLYNFWPINYLMYINPQ